MHGKLMVLGALVVLAGCASPAQRIERKLVEIGVPEGQARCMGSQLQARLTGAQLRRLGELAGVNRERVGRMRLDEIGRLLSDPRDAAMASEVLRAGVGCLI